jgi:hypothetical protein
MSRTRGDRDDKGGREADHLTHQFLIVNQKNSIKDISRVESAMVGRNGYIVEENGITQKIIMKLSWDLRSGSRKVTNDF